MQIELNMMSESDRRKSELFIIAMGKLGGRELNASSDIDIIFFSPYKDELGKECYYASKIREILEQGINSVYK